QSDARAAFQRNANASRRRSVQRANACEHGDKPTSVNTASAGVSWAGSITRRDGASQECSCRLSRHVIAIRSVAELAKLAAVDLFQHAGRQDFREPSGARSAVRQKKQRVAAESPRSVHIV